MFGGKQDEVYLALLELGTGSVVEISKKAGTKRPNTYLVLDELKKRSLVSEVPEANRTVYVAEDPRVLENNLKQKLSDFSELLPFLRAKHNRGTKPKIRFYEGKEALHKLYLNEVFPAESIYFYGTQVGKLLSIFPTLFDDWEKYWWPKQKKKPGSVLEVVSNEPRDIEYAKKVINEREVRILPKDKSSFLADNAVTLDKVFIFSLDHLFTVVIESEDLAKTYRTMVELAWQSCVPAKDWVD